MHIPIKEATTFQVLGNVKDWLMKPFLMLEEKRKVKITHQIDKHSVIKVNASRN